MEATLCGYNATKYSNFHWPFDFKNQAPILSSLARGVDAKALITNAELLSFGKSHVMSHVISSQLLDMQVLVYQSADTRSMAGRSHAPIPRMLHMPPK